MATTTVTLSIGKRAPSNVTVSSVSSSTAGGFSNVWDVVLAAADINTNVGDKLVDATKSYLIIKINGKTLTVAGDPFSSSTQPGSGASVTSRAIESNFGPYEDTVLQDWVNLSPSDLIAKDWIWKGEMYKEGHLPNGEWDTPRVNVEFTKFTTDPDRYFYLTYAKGQGYLDSLAYLDLPLKYSPDRGVAIRGKGNYFDFITTRNVFFIIEGLQYYKEGKMKSFISGNNTGAPYRPRARTSVRSCLVHNANISVCVDAVNSIFYTDTTGALLNYPQASKIINCSILNISTSKQVAISAGHDTSVSLQNCLFLGFSDIISDNTKIMVDDSIVLDGSSYRIATDSAGPIPQIPGSVFSIDPTIQLTDLSIANPVFSLRATNTLSGLGLPSPSSTYTHNLDFGGRSRSAVAPTIGAVEGVWTSIAPPVGGADQQANHQTFSRGIARGIQRGIV